MQGSSVISSQIMKANDFPRGPTEDPGAGGVPSSGRRGDCGTRALPSLLVLVGHSISAHRERWKAPPSSVLPAGFVYLTTLTQGPPLSQTLAGCSTGLPGSWDPRDSAPQCGAKKLRHTRAVTAAQALRRDPHRSTS